MKLEKLIIELKNHKLTQDEIKQKFGIEEEEFQNDMKLIENQGIRIDVTKPHRKHKLQYHINMLPENGNIYHISDKDNTEREMKFGVISDVHIASKFHLPKTFNETLKRFEGEGIKRVFVAGDVVDGVKIYRGHLENLLAFGVEDQTDMAAEAFSKHPNLEFWGIAGNHDYSFTKDNGAKALSILEAKVDNFKNLGDLRADLIYHGIRIRLLHGGSGRAYARSYPSQTYLRDYFGGMEKEDMSKMPHFILLGHYHTVYQSKDHGIWIFQPGAFQDGDNEYCVRKGLTGPSGGWMVNTKYKKGIIDEVTSTYVQPRIAQKEKGKAFSKTTINYR